MAEAFQAWQVGPMVNYTPVVGSLHSQGTLFLHAGSVEPIYMRGKLRKESEWSEPQLLSLH